MSAGGLNRGPWRAEQVVQGGTWDVVRGHGEHREQATVFCPSLDRPAFASYGRKVDAQAVADQLNGGAA